MSGIFDWFRSAANNNAPSPDGAPELMPRSGVNDSAREVMAATKIFYDDPAYRRPFEGYTLTRISGTQFTFTDGAIETNAAALLDITQRVRLVGASGGADAGKVWRGFITSVVYAAPTTTVVIAWVSAVSSDIIGPTLVPPLFEVHLRGLKSAAFRETGTGSEQVPLVSDLGNHVTKAENTLDVGFVDGQSREEIVVNAARGRLNANGGPDIWQRGTSFTAASNFSNAPDNVFADNWVVLSDGADRVDIDRITTDLPPGEELDSAIQMTAATVPANQKHGVATFIEKKDVFDVLGASNGNKISMSFWARLGPISGIDAIRAYLVSMKNEEPTTSPINSWLSGTQGVSVGFNPTDWQLTTGGAVEPVLAVSLNSAWTRYVIEGLELDQSGTADEGIGIVFAVDDSTIISGAQWRLGGVQVVRGDKALPYLRWPRALERERLARYYESTFDWSAGIFPAHNQGNAHALAAISAGLNISADWRFRVPKFKTPTLVSYNPGLAVPPTGNWYDGVNDRAVSSSEVNREGAHVFCTTSTNAIPHRIALSVHANVWGNN